MLLFHCQWNNIEWRGGNSQVEKYKALQNANYAYNSRDFWTIQFVEVPLHLYHTILQWCYMASVAKLHIYIYNHYMGCICQYLNYVIGYWLTLWMHERFLYVLYMITLALIHSIDIVMERLQRKICLANYWFLCCWIIRVADFCSWFFIDEIWPYKALSFSFHFIDYHVATNK